MPFFLPLTYAPGLPTKRLPTKKLPINTFVICKVPYSKLALLFVRRNVTSRQFIGAMEIWRFVTVKKGSHKKSPDLLGGDSLDFIVL